MESYTYDNAGNRLSRVLGTVTENYQDDNRNRLTQRTVDGIISAYTYDSNGNLLSETVQGQTTYYEYDVFNRLIETTSPDGTWMTNNYDALGLRTSVLENGIWTGFTFDGANIIAETNADNELTKRYIRGHSLLVRQDSTQIGYYLHNAHGDVTAITDSSAQILNQYTYDAFGRTVSSMETVHNRFMYAGEQFDHITSQYYLRTRYYDPSTGRFTQEDPFRGDGLNLYAYVSNNPVKYVDPWGLCKDESGNSRYENVLDLVSAYPSENFIEEGLKYYSSAWTGEIKGVYGYVTGTINSVGSLINDPVNIIVKPAIVNMFAFAPGSELTKAGRIAKAYKLNQFADYADSINSGINKFVEADSYHKTAYVSEVVTEITAAVGTSKALGELGTWVKGKIPRARFSFGLSEKFKKLFRRNRGIEGAGEAPNKVSDLAKDMKSWLGEDAKVITNKAGDKIFLSKDGTKRIRFDINKPHPHNSPHGHIEELKNGEWVGNGQLYPKDVPQN